MTGEKGHTEAKWPYADKGAHEDEGLQRGKGVTHFKHGGSQKNF